MLRPVSTSLVVALASPGTPATANLIGATPRTSAVTSFWAGADPSVNWVDAVPSVLVVSTRRLSVPAPRDSMNDTTIPDIGASFMSVTFTAIGPTTAPTEAEAGGDATTTSFAGTGRRGAALRSLHAASTTSAATLQRWCATNLIPRQQPARTRREPQLPRKCSPRRGRNAANAPESVRHLARARRSEESIPACAPGKTQNPHRRD